MATPTAIKDVSTPRDDYLAQSALWEKCRAVCGSEEEVLSHDLLVHAQGNFLIPFSPSMTQEQYNLFKREAELPGISAEFTQLLVGGLLRKEPQLELPKDAPEEALDWLTNEFGVDGTPLNAFMQSTVHEEVVTTRGWIFVDYDEDEKIPFATMYPAESIVNWRRSKTELTQVIVKVEELLESSNEFHPVYQPAYYVHELVNDVYQVRTFKQQYDENGNVKDNNWLQVGDPVIPEMRGKPLNFIPAWPSNGEIELQNPFLLTIVNKEINLFNKISRRNHLLLGAGTYTPYVSGVADEADFLKITRSGLGSWLHLPDKDAKIDVVKVPTEALVDYDRSIEGNIEEMARLGVRMLSPETAQSGVALQLRNASQTARLGTLNTKLSAVMTQVIAVMLNWRYGKEYDASEIKFKMQDDFDNIVTGEGWLRLATEWYENNLIPRSVWINLLKRNDIIPDDYNDEEGSKEMDKDMLDFKKYSDTMQTKVNDNAIT